jgi:hypothetical protein
MTEKGLEVLRRTLALTEGGRAVMSRLPIESLDSASDKGAERTWDEEIGRCASILDSGKSRTDLWNEVQQRIFARRIKGA